MRIAAAVASLSAVVAQSWSVINSAAVGQSGTGLSFFDSNNGIIATTDGVGYEIWATSDGGKTWPTQVPNTDLYIFGLYDAAVSGTNAVIAGDTFTQYSTDSAGHFNTSSGGAGGGAAYNYGPNFALVGEFGSSNTPGVAISTDGGATFTTVDASSVLTTNPGYGWFVDANNWYVTGFTAPSGGGSTTTGTGSTSTGSGSGGSTSAQAAVTRRRRIGNKVALVSTQGAGAKYEFSPVATHGRALQTPTGSYSGQIIKTTNGGSSWTSIFSEATYELNGIACQDATHCVAVGSDDNGAYIVTTSNGNTFNLTANITTAGAELIDVRAVGDNTYWAVGGVISSSDLTATFYVSTDNGNSWKQDTTIDNYFAVGIDCNVAASSYTCWAVLQDSNSNTWVASASS